MDDLAIPQPIVCEMVSKSGFLYTKSDACFDIFTEHAFEYASLPLEANIDDVVSAALLTNPGRAMLILNTQTKRTNSLISHDGVDILDRIEAGRHAASYPVVSPCGSSLQRSLADDR